jgi:hypothetical protein
MEKKMNKKWLPHIITAGAFMAFIVLGLASATMKETQFDNAKTLKEHLDSQPDNYTYPIRITVTVNESIKDIVDVINSSGKYVDLTISGNALTTVPPDTFKDCKFVNGITLPDNAEALFKEFLSSQPVNSPDKPIKITITVDNSTLENIVDIIKSANRYVSLNISGSMLTIIKENAFKDCKYLTSINIPSSADYIKFSAFWGLENLTAINVSSSNRVISSDNGILYSKDGTILYLYPAGKIGDYTIPNGVIAIAEKAFYGANISGITIQGGSGAYFDVSTGHAGVNVFSIGKGAFSNCTKLTRVTIKGVVDLQSDSFDGNFYQFFEKNYATLPNGQRSMIVTTASDGNYIREIGSNTWRKQ